MTDYEEERMLAGIRAFHLKPVMIEDDPDCTAVQQLAVKNNSEIRAVIESVAKHFGTDAAEVLSRSTERLPVAARQAVVKVLRDQFGYSYPKIGRILHQHQTTIQHAYKKPMHTRTRQAVIAALRAA